MPMVSIIVPVYNVEAYVQRCIDSILAQTYRDIEVIIIDDGSTDDSGLICDKYLLNDNRVRVIHQNNKGVSEARNKGIECASGNFLMFVDSDDFIATNCVEIMTVAVQQYDADICVAPVQMVSEEGKKLRILAAPDGRRVLYGRNILEYFGKKNDDTFRCPLCKLVKKDICKSFLFPVNRHYAEDFAVVYRWYSIARSVVEINDELYFYQIRNGSAVHSEYSVKKIGDIETLEELLTYLSENEYRDLFIEYLHRYAWHVADNVRSISYLKGYYYEKRNLKKKARSIIWKYHNQGITPLKDPDVYNAAYPVLMWFYWTVCAVKGKIKNLAV